MLKDMIYAVERLDNQREVKRALIPRARADQSIVQPMNDLERDREIILTQTHDLIWSWSVQLSVVVVVMSGGKRILRLTPST